MFGIKVRRANEVGEFSRANIEASDLYFGVGLAEFPV